MEITRHIIICNRRIGLSVITALRCSIFLVVITSHETVTIATWLEQITAFIPLVYHRFTSMRFNICVIFIVCSNDKDIVRVGTYKLKHEVVLSCHVLSGIRGISTPIRSDIGFGNFIILRIIIRNFHEVFTN